jgi:hypothetical protein
MRNYYPEAIPILEQVRLAYPNDTTLAGIIDDSEGIYKRLESGLVPVPTITPLPANAPSP